MRIVLADGSGGWLDGQSVKLQFDVVNEATGADDAATAAMRLRPISPWGFFKQIRITCGGSLVEDFDYSRKHEMFHMMNPADIRDNVSVGDDNGIGGGVCNVLYFPRIMSKERIDANYAILKNINPPII